MFFPYGRYYIRLLELTYCIGNVPLAKLFEGFFIHVFSSEVSSKELFSFPFLFLPELQNGNKCSVSNIIVRLFGSIYEKGMTTTPIFLSGESPWTEEPVGLQSMGLQRVRYNWATKSSTAHVTVREVLPEGLWSSTSLLLNIQKAHRSTILTQLAHLRAFLLLRGKGKLKK